MHKQELGLLLLPNLERAIVPIEKLSDYALNPDHPRGKDKAKVFKAVLGIERQHAAVLAEIIRGSLHRALAVERTSDEHGHSWTTYHEIFGVNARAAIVTVGWKFATGEPEVPKLISCYIDTDRQEDLAALLCAEQSGS